MYVNEFVYHNSILPLGALASFRANLKDQNVNLTWDLSKGSPISKVYLERGVLQHNKIRIGGIAVDSDNLN